MGRRDFKLVSKTVGVMRLRHRAIANETLIQNRLHEEGASTIAA